MSRAFPFFMLQNFVGLSVSDGYIATGSETNEVCISCASTSSILLIDTIHMLVVGVFTPRVNTIWSGLDHTRTSIWVSEMRVEG